MILLDHTRSQIRLSTIIKLRLKMFVLHCTCIYKWKALQYSAGQGLGQKYIGTNNTMNFSDKTDKCYCVTIVRVSSAYNLPRLLGLWYFNLWSILKPTWKDWQTGVGKRKWTTLTQASEVLGWWLSALEAFFYDLKVKVIQIRGHNLYWQLLNLARFFN